MVAKSAFWLGLVYSAMPFDLGKPNALAPMTAAAPYFGNSLGAYASALRENADGWRSAIEVAAALSCAIAPAPRPPSSGRTTLRP